MNDADDSAIPYTECELIQRAINVASSKRYADMMAGKCAPYRRWEVAKEVFGTGATVSALICYRCGFDAEKTIGGATNGYC